jgi:hypothetical protein
MLTNHPYQRKKGMYTNCFLNKDFDNATNHSRAQYKAEALGG